MSHNEDLWTCWGRYTNEAAIKAASNFDEIVLNFSGRTMFAVHPVPTRYLNSLNPEEHRMLRQHLDYKLREGVHDDFDRAVGETLTNLNTLANVGRQRNVQFDNEVECDDGSRYRSPLPGDRPGQGLFNDFVPPMSSDEWRPRRNAQSGSQQHASVATDPAAEYYNDPMLPPGSGPGFWQPISPHLTNRGYSAPEENNVDDHRPPRRLRSILRSVGHRLRPQQPLHPEELPVRADSPRRSPRQDIQGRKPLPVRESTSHDAHSLQEQMNKPFESDDRPSSFNALDPDLYTLRPNHAHIYDTYDSVPEHRSQDWAAEHGETLAPFQDWPQRRAKSSTRRLAAQTVEDDEQFARSMQQDFDDEGVAHELQSKLHVGDRQDVLGTEYRGRTNQQPASRYDYDQRFDEDRFDELDKERLPRIPRVGRSALYSGGGGMLRGVGVEHRRLETRHRSDDSDLYEGRHHYGSGHRHRDIHHAEDEHRLHGRHRASSKYRSSAPHSPFGPFPSSLIRTVIRNGTRSDFFEALYTLHPNQAPSVYRIHRYRNAERTSRHEPAIEAMLRVGRVKDVERVFRKENTNALFEELGMESKDRKVFW
ncbi:uncharacterized protein N0V89_005610 [Didymosphaeria variabile]|uniref:Uncharacterized protein n=1 Tax=Didymosphaeria variabile TaxID=1932322 RepID=A0A9W8XNI7_9PLEO|nr:uncharacterized protein N0V89_005610 [Didymosphaeria variabile]KAJ4353880.1 hypothetical protein N0V89_005610 [Didymosphaeria variabile]